MKAQIKAELLKIRSTRTTVGLILGMVALILLLALLSELARAADALMGLRVRHLLSPGIGAIVLIAWAAALVAIGIVLSVRQDIN